MNIDEEIERSKRFIHTEIEYRFSVWQQTVWFLDMHPEKRGKYINPRLNQHYGRGGMYNSRDDFEKAIGISHRYTLIS